MHFGGFQNGGFLKNTYIKDNNNRVIVEEQTCFKKGGFWTTHQLHNYLIILIKDADGVAQNNLASLGLANIIFRNILYLIFTWQDSCLEILHIFLHKFDASCVGIIAPVRLYYINQVFKGTWLCSEKKNSFSKYCKSLLNLLFQGGKSRLKIGFFLLRQPQNNIIVVSDETYLEEDSSNVELLVKIGTGYQRDKHLATSMVYKKWLEGIIYLQGAFREALGITMRFKISHGVLRDSKTFQKASILNIISQFLKCLFHRVFIIKSKCSVYLFFSLFISGILFILFFNHQHQYPGSFRRLFCKCDQKSDFQDCKKYPLNSTACSSHADSPRKILFLLQHFSRLILPSFEEQSLCSMHSDCAKTSTYANWWNLYDSLDGACCMSTAGSRGSFFAVKTPWNGSIIYLLKLRSRFNEEGYIYYHHIYYFSVTYPFFPYHKFSSFSVHIFSLSLIKILKVISTTYFSFIRFLLVENFINLKKAARNRLETLGNIFITSNQKQSIYFGIYSF
ncbi:hypothetical protein VP01_2127g1 [Puccinia sorghi]|uniref:Uncharacterized protein n=1 Tax=Puccinia sorghi TaxID=27349 RepID=A0A0L6V9W9_9BASI|nr:hypothetical protein VP01_2127g1 [Puccinia sorghi]